MSDDMPDEERCSLCPSSGPILRLPDPEPLGEPSSNEDTIAKALVDPDSIPDLIWIACSKCQSWYHSHCILLDDESKRKSIPQAVMEELEKNFKDGWPFEDWTVWLNRWYCKSCLDLSRDLTNSNRPHHPLLATTKANFPPRQTKRRSMGAKGVSSASPRNTPTPAKRIKLEDDQKAEPPATNGLNGEGDSASARPKRQAALNRPDYHALHHHIATPTAKWLHLIADPEKYNVTILDGNFPRVSADKVTRAWIEARLDETDGEPGRPSAPGSLFYGPTREPLIVRPEDGGFEGMGGKLPGKEFTVQDVARLVGPDRQVDVIDVATQSSSQWTLKQWAEYVRTGTDPNGNKTKVYNIISLEVTGTELAKKVRAPRLVREIDWVDNFWNFPGGKGNVVDEKNNEVNGHSIESAKDDHAAQNGAIGALNGEQAAMVQNGEVKPKGKAPNSWPKVQLYCLMGMKGSWTDWHVDFAASSVYYTIHSGSKVFYFIRPTEKNLKAYNEWSGSYEMQQSTWLGSMCDEVRRVVLIEGDTMIIPAGYIHAVYTPMNSIVFGGNFVHSYDIPAQLRLRQIEIDTKVPQRFRFPFFDRLCWYVADRYCSDLRQCRAYRPRAMTTLSPPHHVVLEGLVHLANFLIAQTDILENDEEEDKKRSLIFNKIPSEIVKDPSGLARELLWRVHRELRHSGVKEECAALAPPTESITPRRATSSQSSQVNAAKTHRPPKTSRHPAVSRIANFEPVPWETKSHSSSHSDEVIKVLRPTNSAGDREHADLSTIVKLSQRHRVRELEDGRTVLEEQDILFTEKKTIWAAEASSSARSPNTPQAGDS